MPAADIGVRLTSFLDFTTLLKYPWLLIRRMSESSDLAK